MTFILLRISTSGSRRSIAFATDRAWGRYLTARPRPAECAGLFSISLGLSANFPNDNEMLEHGMVIYDALYTWCRSLQAETHNWPAKATV